MRVSEATCKALHLGQGVFTRAGSDRKKGEWVQSERQGLNWQLQKNSLLWGW